MIFGTFCALAPYISIDLFNPKLAVQRAWGVKTGVWCKTFTPYRKKGTRELTTRKWEQTKVSREQGNTQILKGNMRYILGNMLPVLQKVFCEKKMFFCILGNKVNFDWGTREEGIIWKRGTGTKKWGTGNRGGKNQGNKGIWYPPRRVSLMGQTSWLGIPPQTPWHTPFVS